MNVNAVCVEKFPLITLSCLADWPKALLLMKLAKQPSTRSEVSGPSCGAWPLRPVSVKATRPKQ